MLPSRRHCLFASLALVVITAWAPQSSAETLTITSAPPGATVEINGIVAGTTPYHVDYLGSYFHKPHTVFTARLEHAMSLRVSKAGYKSQQITISTGPFQWIGLTGKHHGDYFLLSADHFDIKLDPIEESIRTSDTDPHAGPLRPRNNLGQFVAQDHLGETGSIAISSDPVGADIYVDGKFVGQTPSTVRLSAGQHRIELKSAGKPTWTRDLEVLKDSELTLHPALSGGGADH
jgi:PEGA domain